MPPGVCAEASPETAFSARTKKGKILHQGPIRTDGLTVDCDPEEVAELFELAASQFQRTEVPQHEMVIGSVGLQFVAVFDQFIGQCLGVGDHLLGVGLPGGLASL
jgi:hypothetical protein